MNYSKIKTLLSERNISISEMCHKVEISEQGFHQMIRKKSMKIEVLEKIALYLSVSVSIFFDETLEETQVLGEPVLKYNKGASDYKEKYIASLERENEFLAREVERLKSEK